MKKSTIIAIAIAVIAVVWIASGMLGGETHETTQSVNERKTENGAAEKKLTTVRVKTIKAEPFVNDVVLTGITEASRTVTLRSEIEGMVTEMPVEKGEAVAEGDALMVLDVRERAERLKEAKERVKQREIEYNAAANLAQKGFNSKVRVAQSKADLEEARALLKQAELDLGNTSIKAPFDSVVFDTDVEIGDFLRVGDEIVRLVDLDPITVSGFVTEHSMSGIKKGNTARIVFINGSEVEGSVSYVAPAANPETRTFAIEVTIDNPDNKIVEGMTVEIYLPMPEQQLHKISPSILSLNDDGQIGVKTLDDQNVVSFVPVQIVADKADYMLIDGLPETARVITVGQDFVVGGQTVEPTESDADGLL